MKKQIIVITMLFLCYSYLQAQVTLGSTEKPAEGALLDLKNKKPQPTENQLITADKALLYPRVQLVDIDDLTPLVVGASDTQKQQYTGTSVYNVTISGDFSDIALGEGLYVWDGSQWDKLGSTASVVAPSFTKGTLPSMFDNENIYLPNSYIVQAGQTMEIPVAKAYAMWHDYKLPADAKYSAGKTLAEVEGSSISGTGTVELVWQDVTDLITAANISLVGTGENAKINITPTTGKTGNAVIGIKYNNILRWSWHIWVTNYNPATTNVTLSSLGYDVIMMDRNLGATANDKTINSQGLLYQWGRKDPFPNSKSYNQLATETTAYDISNATNDKTVTTVAQPQNLIEAVKNPYTFYTCVTSGSGTLLMDWYSSDLLTSADVQESIQNDYLWDEYGYKTAFDPCPEGWRVPNERYGISPWSLAMSNSASDPSYLSSYGGVADNFTTDFGVTFDSLASYMIGYYPCLGNINGETGSFENVGGSTTIWLSTNGLVSQLEQNALKISQSSIHAQNPTIRSTGASVRCVKE